MMATFSELAVEVRLAATREAFGAEALEVLAARSEHPVFASTLRDARASGLRLGEAYRLLKALIPHEAAVRLLAGSQ